MLKNLKNLKKYSYARFVILEFLPNSNSFKSVKFKILNPKFESMIFEPFSIDFKFGFSYTISKPGISKLNIEKFSHNIT